MNIHELICLWTQSSWTQFWFIKISWTAHEELYEQFMKTCSWTACKIFDEQSMDRSCIFMNVHEQTMKVHDFMNKFSPGMV